jgi:hypothetical protein
MLSVVFYGSETLLLAVGAVRFENSVLRRVYRRKKQKDNGGSYVIFFVCAHHGVLLGGPNEED